MISFHLSFHLYLDPIKLWVQHESLLKKWGKQKVISFLYLSLQFTIDFYIFKTRYFRKDFYSFYAPESIDPPEKKMKKKQTIKTVSEK